MSLYNPHLNGLFGEACFEYINNDWMRDNMNPYHALPLSREYAVDVTKCLYDTLPGQGKSSARLSDKLDFDNAEHYVVSREMMTLEIPIKGAPKNADERQKLMSELHGESPCPNTSR